MSSSTNPSKEMKSNELLSPIDLISKSLKLYQAHSATLLGYSAWLLLPFIVYVGMDFLPISTPVFVVAIILSILELFLAFWIGIILTKLVFSYDGKKLVDSQKIQIESVQLVRPVVLVALIQLLITLGGFILLIIPGLIFSIWYSFAQIAAVLDGKKGMDALRFSKKLVTGRFWKITYRTIVGPLVMAVLYVLILGILIMVISALIGFDTSTILNDSVAPMWMQSLEAVGEVLILPLFIAYGTLLYKDAKNTLASKKQLT